MNPHLINLANIQVGHARATVIKSILEQTETNEAGVYRCWLTDHPMAYRDAVSSVNSFAKVSAMEDGLSKR